MARQASRKTVKKSPSKAVAIQTLTTPGVGGRRAFVARATKETRIAAAIHQPPAPGNQSASETLSRLVVFGLQPGAG